MIDRSISRVLDDLIDRYPILSSCKESIRDAYIILEDCFLNGHILLIAGNGGSCSDSDHIVGELMKGFKSCRRINDNLKNELIRVDKNRGQLLSMSLQQGLPSIALNNHQSLNTAFINDVKNGGDFVFAQQVLGYGNTGDVFLGISTSGNSENIVNACIVSKAKGLKTIGLCGKDGGLLRNLCDVSIIVPLSETYMIQELHLPIYHCLCLMLEKRFFE